MSGKDKKKTAKPENLLEEEEESYISSLLKYIIKKFSITAKDGGTVNIHIDKFMSGIPKDPPPY